MWTSLRLDARSKGRRRDDLFCGAPRERDRPLLLSESVGKLRGRSHSCLEGDTLFRCERPVGERRQLGDLPVTALVCSTTSHRHGTTKGNGESAVLRPPQGCARSNGVRRDLAVPPGEEQGSAQPQGELR